MRSCSSALKRRRPRDAEPEVGEPLGAGRVDEPAVHRRHPEEQRRAGGGVGQHLLGVEAVVQHRRGAGEERAVQADPHAVHVEQRQAQDEAIVAASSATPDAATAALASRLPCESGTPFGAPVVPDVYGRRAGSPEAAPSRSPPRSSAPVRRPTGHPPELDVRDQP